MAGREVREYTNLTDPKDKKLGKGKDRIDDEEITFQRMVAKLQYLGSFLITCPGRDLGFLHWVLDMYRCKRLPENVEATFMDGAAVAETSPASVPLPLRVEPKPKSGIRQQDLLKRVVEVKPKRRNVSSPSDVDPSSTTLSGQPSKKHHSVSDHEKEKGQSSTTFSKVGEETILDNPVKSLVAAYESSDDED
ncbi:hypothetical protein DH2020_042595 [Rehmannia glutinosa]|uniref:Uncharacterized protein n=1 Tax=Rehmannia glutinosa TaxID=99300 RepID=A0ABR0UN07_REHGL